MLDLHLEHCWEYMVNLRPVTLRIYGLSDIHIPPAVLTEPVQWKEMVSADAQVIRMGTLFVWPQKFSPQPPIGSVIIDEFGTYWTIFKLVYKDIVKTWEAYTLNLSIMPGPNAQNPERNLATVLIASYEKGEANEAKAIWRGAFTGQDPPVTDPNATPTDTIQCRFQPLKELSQIQFSSEFASEQYRCYFNEPWPVQLAGGEYRLVSPDGNRFRIMEYVDQLKIDKLPCALAIRITEGYEYWQGGTPPPVPQ